MKTVLLEALELEYASVYTSIDPEKTYTIKGKDLVKIIEWEKNNVLDNIPASVYWKDKNGVILGCNQQMVKNLGLQRRDQVIGKTNHDFLSQETADAIQQLDQEIIEHDLVVQTEEVGIVPFSDEPIFVFSSKRTLKTPQNDIIGVQGISIDITKQKQAEKKALEEEQKRISAEIKILEQEKQVLFAQEEQKATTTLTGSVAHDTKNRLSPIRMRLEMLWMVIQKTQGKDLSVLNPRELEMLYQFLPKTLADIDSANEEIIKMNQYIRDRHLASRDQPVFYANTLRIEKIIHEVLQAYSEHTHLNIETQIEDFVFKGDLVAIYKILHNLIQNAERQIKEKGRGKIILSTEENKKYHILKVKDTAGGVTQVLVDRILDLHKTDEVKGTGIGLSSAQILMQAMKGKIEVRLEDQDYISFGLFFPKV